ncbi:MAG TPA: histidine phosphatase family protein, partial [Burkholderiaceae bacterium]|nr:histidine phosphatase family protein [Burkholderiaceae bacterium]
MSLILVRHGETALNASRVIQPIDTPLSERGLAQAAAVGRRLSRGEQGARPRGILSSDLPRALQTAMAIASATGLEVRTTELLHERNFGDWRGRAYDTLGFDPLATDDAPPGGESAAQFRARVALAFDAILAAHRA